MAHSKQARKRIRQNAARRLRNRSVKSSLRTAVKKFKATVQSGDAEAVAAAYKSVQKRADKTARKGIIAKGTAARMKSRLLKSAARAKKA